MSELPDDFELAAWMPLPPLDPQHVPDDLDGLTVQLAGFVERGPGDLDLLMLVLDDGSIIGIGARHDSNFDPPDDALDSGTVALFFGVLEHDETVGPSVFGRQAAARLTGVRLDKPEVACSERGVPRILLIPLDADERLGVAATPTVTAGDGAGREPAIEMVVALEGRVLGDRRAQRRRAA
jgi:hypothetical protein